MAEPWDDSALINAFNSAIAKYKVMHGIPVRDKGSCEDATENNVNMDSDSRGIASLSERDLEQNEPSEKEENPVEPPLPADNQSTYEDGHAWNGNVGDAQRGYDGSVDPHCDTQNHGHSASAESCYLCQWNAYYHQVGAWASPAGSFPNGLHCQYCGYLNHFGEDGKNQNQTSQTHHLPQDVSAFPDMVKAAVAEALKTTGGQKSTGNGLKGSQDNSSFSDVAVAWFLAGFHTSRYLSQSKES